MSGVRIRCSRCNQEFQGTVCPFCGQPVAISGVGYTHAAPPPPRPKRRIWVGVVLAMLTGGMLVGCRILTHML